MTLHPPVSGALTSAPRNTILHGDCVTLMDTIPDNSVDFILTDPPYLVNYRPRSGQRQQAGQLTFGSPAGDPFALLRHLGGEPARELRDTIP